METKIGKIGTQDVVVLNAMDIGRLIYTDIALFI